MITLSLLFASGIITYFLTKNLKKPYKSFLIYYGIIIVLVMGSRHRWYSFYDEGMYCTFYEQATGMPFSAYMDSLHNAKDVGYYFITWALAQVFPNGQFLLYFQVAVFISAVFTFIYLECRDPLCAVFLLFGTGLLFFYMSALRQGFALSFCLFSFELFKCALKKKGGALRVLLFIFSLALLFVGYSMHKTALVFSVLLMISVFKDKRIITLLTVVTVLVVFFLRDTLLEYGNDMIDTDYTTGTSTSLVGFVIITVMLFVPLLLDLFLKSKGDDVLFSCEKENTVLLRVGQYLCIIFYLLRLYALVFERIAFYFMIFICPLYELTMIKYFNKKDRQSITMIIGILCFVLTLYRFANGLRIGEFTFFWQK